MPNFIDEKQGQTQFYTDYLARINNELTIDDVLSDNNDGVINGNILEFKLNINDLNAVLFQTIKYLSKRRISGKEIPANIFLVSLNSGDAYLYKSKDYLDSIEKIYTLSASKDNLGFVAQSPIQKFEYLNNDKDAEDMIKELKTCDWTKINIDENCIVSWAERYYRENPTARKQDFIGDHTGKVNVIGEIRKPDKFKDFINTYTGEDNDKFRYLMGKLNDWLSKADLGAFYTPKLYCKKSLELLRQAIDRVPEGNDYVIIDRCAGTGNLEQFLSAEELSHTIVSTIEYYEYKVLMSLLGDKVRHIIPPTEKEDTFNAGLVRGNDALSEEFVNNNVIKQYIDNPKCTIILFENPPYSESTSIEHQKTGTSKASSSGWKDTYVMNNMKKETSGVVQNDLANAFIWSAFKYYLRQDTDSYVVYSPIKYWKTQHLIDKEFIDGFAFNRGFFDTKNKGTISCILWSNKEAKLEKLTLKAFNIVNDELSDEGEIIVKKCYYMFSEKYYDSRKFDDDKQDGIASNLDGTEVLPGSNLKVRVKKTYNQNILGYISVDAFGFENNRLRSCLTRNEKYNGNGFNLRSDNYLEKLPLFAASRYSDMTNDWKVIGMTMKTADKYQQYEKDYKSGKLNKFLYKALLWTCLTHYAHLRSLTGSDKRFYRNELSLDTTNGETIASQDIKKMEFNNREKQLMEIWEKILELAKNTTEYNPEYTYGLYQIDEELNTKYKDENDKTVYNYPELNGQIKVMKAKLKEYYLKEIVPTLKKYEFLK